MIHFSSMLMRRYQLINNTNNCVDCETDSNLIKFKLNSQDKPHVRIVTSIWRLNQQNHKRYQPIIREIVRAHQRWERMEHKRFLDRF